MPQADHAPITSADAAATAGGEAAARWPLQDMEPELRALRSAVAVLGHVAASPNEVDPDEVAYIHDRIIKHHARLDALWTAAWEERGREDAEHRRALEEAKTATAPLSKAGVERFAALVRVLRVIAGHIVEQCDQADAALASAAADGRA